MRCSTITKAVVGFLDSVLMGCFLSCFRIRPDPPAASSHRDPLLPKNRLGEVFLDEEKGFEGSGDGGVDEELKREAKYLKSCGAISDTPPEIRKASRHISVENTNERDHISSIAPGIEETSISEEKLSAGFNCDKHDVLRHKLNFEETEHLLEVEPVPQSVSRDKSPFQNIRSQLLDSSDSPYPTPLVLTDDMQTPGTIYTAHKGTSRTGKRARTRTQFIYPVLRPIENKLEWMELREESSRMQLSDPPKRRNLGPDSSKKPQKTSPSSVTKKSELSESGPYSFPNDNAYQDQEVISLEKFKSQNGIPQLLDSTELANSNSDNKKHAVSSLSRWLKPSSADEKQGDVKSTVGEQLNDENSIVADRPIFVFSAVNWNGDDPTPMLPRSWDGNGIPNTTTKYKEDQKVSWHATPFEERLEKVLSDEKLYPPRKLISGRLIELEEKAE